MLFENPVGFMIIALTTFVIFVACLYVGMDWWDRHKR